MPAPLAALLLPPVAAAAGSSWVPGAALAAGGGLSAAGLMALLSEGYTAGRDTYMQDMPGVSSPLVGGPVTNYPEAAPKSSESPRAQQGDVRKAEPAPAQEGAISAADAALLAKMFPSVGSGGKISPMVAGKLNLDAERNATLDIANQIQRIQQEAHDKKKGPELTAWRKEAEEFDAANPREKVSWSWREAAPHAIAAALRGQGNIGANMFGGVQGAMQAAQAEKDTQRDKKFKRFGELQQLGKDDRISAEALRTFGNTQADALANVLAIPENARLSNVGMSKTEKDTNFKEENATARVNKEGEYKSAELAQRRDIAAANQANQRTLMALRLAGKGAGKPTILPPGADAAIEGRVTEAMRAQKNVDPRQQKTEAELRNHFRNLYLQNVVVGGIAGAVDDADTVKYGTTDIGG